MAHICCYKDDISLCTLKVNILIEKDRKKIKKREREMWKRNEALIDLRGKSYLLLSYHISQYVPWYTVTDCILHNILVLLFWFNRLFYVVMLLVTDGTRFFESPINVIFWFWQHTLMCKWRDYFNDATYKCIDNISYSTNL